MKLSELNSLKGRRILVTGGARGIGKAVAGMLLEEGAAVALADIDRAGAAETAGQLACRTGGRCVGLGCDVSDSQSVADMMSRLAGELGGLDGVFNNAGICMHKGALDVSPAEWGKVMDVNLNGVFYVAQAAARQFIAQGGGGSIVNTASMSGIIVNTPQEQASYNASKAAVIHLTKSLAVEWAPRGIRVNAISPGYIMTEMTGTVRRDWQEYWTGLIPFGRMGRPEELAGAVAYLLSDASSYTSGCNIVIDGCFTCV